MFVRRVCEKVFLTSPAALRHLHWMPSSGTFRSVGPAVGRGWPLFRRLSRSVHGDATGFEGGGSLLCWSAQMACERACGRARVL